MRFGWRLWLALCSPALMGCSGSGGTVLGTLPPGSAVVSSSGLKPSKSPVTLRGRMVEKCPVAGCWFVLRDAGGEIKVDTKSAGFVISDVPLNTEVTVAGTADFGGERRIIATGLKY